MAKMLSLGDVALRALEPDDLDILYTWESEADAWASSNTVAPYSRHLLWEYLKTYDADIFKTKETRMVITCGEVPAGTIDVFNLDVRNRRAEVGVFVDSRHRGKGVGETALQIVKRYAKTVLGLHQIYAIVACSNQVARDAFRSAGFVESAHLADWIVCQGELQDAVVMQCLL